MVTTSVADLQRLRGRISTHVDLLEEAAFDHDELQLELGRQVATCLLTLLDDPSALDAEHRSLVRATIEYFILTDDSDNDVSSPIGMEDDARMVNDLCQELGRTDLTIKLS
jgi:hypothetical protein